MEATYELITVDTYNERRAASEKMPFAQRPHVLSARREELEKRIDLHELGKRLGRYEGKAGRAADSVIESLNDELAAVIREQSKQKRQSNRA
jgi:hypothetical protein